MLMQRHLNFLKINIRAYGQILLTTAVVNIDETKRKYILPRVVMVALTNTSPAPSADITAHAGNSPSEYAGNATIGKSIAVTKTQRMFKSVPTLIISTVSK